jgi:hypothetical protein
LVLTLLMVSEDEGLAAGDPRLGSWSSRCRWCLKMKGLPQRQAGIRVLDLGLHIVDGVRR